VDAFSGTRARGTLTLKRRCITQVKTAALVGHAFSLPFLKDCAPPSLGGEALEDAVGDLVALGLLEVLPDAGDAVAGHDDARYGAGKKGAT